jgi:hypothetical protein
MGWQRLVEVLGEQCTWVSRMALDGVKGIVGGGMMQSSEVGGM